MVMTISRRVFVCVAIVIASIPVVAAGEAQERTQAAKAGSIAGYLWTAGNAAIINGSVQLRNTGTGAIDMTTRTHTAGEFMFDSVPAGAYVIEYVITNGSTDTRTARASGQPFTLAAGETVATFVRLPRAGQTQERAGASEAEVHAADTAGLTAPVVLRSVPTRYTADGMRAKIQGTVELVAVIEVDGTVGEVSVLKSLDPNLGLDAEAVAAMKQWRFKPGILDGKPVRVLILSMLEFRLR